MRFAVLAVLPLFKYLTRLAFADLDIDRGQVASEAADVLADKKSNYNRKNEHSEEDGAMAVWGGFRWGCAEAMYLQEMYKAWY
ncbi:hypothetical protein HJFPF1_00681 [Paramyrothecium foliicola]|nr:hypothetical protein HJFPF1_00681 [Paramyrothecium foliicola]